MTFCAVYKFKRHFEWLIFFNEVLRFLVSPPKFHRLDPCWIILTIRTLFCHQTSLYVCFFSPPSRVRVITSWKTIQIFN